MSCAVHDMYVVASQGILVDGTYSGTKVSFVSTEDGREVLSSTRASDGRDLTWNVFHGGIAVQNEDWTVPLAGFAGYPGGAIVAATGEGSVSLFSWIPSPNSLT